MLRALQVLRIHLLELEKVQDLCKDFCNRYITCLRSKMQSETFLRSDYGGYDSDEEISQLEAHNKTKEVTGMRSSIRHSGDMTIMNEHVANQQAAAVAAAQMAAMHAAAVTEDNFRIFCADRYGNVSIGITKQK